MSQSLQSGQAHEGRSVSLDHRPEAHPYRLVSQPARITRIVKVSNKSYKHFIHKPRLNPSDRVEIARVSVRLPISSEMKEAIQHYGFQAVDFSTRSRYARCGYQVDVIRSTLQVVGDDLEADLFVYPTVKGSFIYTESIRQFFANGEELGRFYIFDENDLVDHRKDSVHGQRIRTAIEAGEILLPEGYRLEQDGTVSVPLLPRTYRFLSQAIHETREQIKRAHRSELANGVMKYVADDSPIPPRSGRICAIKLALNAYWSAEIVPRYGRLVHLNSRLLDGNTGHSQSKNRTVIVEVFNPTDTPISLSEARVALRFIGHDEQAGSRTQPAEQFLTGLT